MSPLALPCNRKLMAFGDCLPFVISPTDHQVTFQTDSQQPFQLQFLYCLFHFMLHIIYQNVEL
jgi:hypothetical protein